MRFYAQDSWQHYYEVLTPTTDCRRWATYILNKLRVPKRYISRKQGYLSTGDVNYVARYVGYMNPDQYRAMLNYTPYAPQGVQFSCPTCS